MPFGLDMGKIQDTLNGDFTQLTQRLDQVVELLTQILNELRTQRGGTPT